MCYDTIIYINYNLIQYLSARKGFMKNRLLIGAIVTDCHIDFQSEIMRGIISQAFKSNCDVAVIAPLYNFSYSSVHKDAERAIFSLILSSRIDGFIYDRNSFCGDEIREYIEQLLRRSGKPVMLLDYADHKSFETTSVDDRSAFEEITDHLIDVHGCKKVYCLTGPQKTYNAEERLEGYKDSMKKHGLFFDRTYIEYGDFWHEAADNYAKKIISGELDRPEAVVCGNDVMAIRLTNALTAAGIRVPEDIAITGYDASEEGYRAVPSITSYSRPNFQLGAEAVRRLYRIITGKICRKVPNENGMLRLGRSCGCHDDPHLRHNATRMNTINSRFETYLLYGDMLFDITNSSDIKTFADKLDNHTYYLYQMSHLNVCLTKKYIDSMFMPASANTELDFVPGDDMQTVYSKSSVFREYPQNVDFSSNDILPYSASERPYPTAYYISPLHYNNNFFGYTAVSFGKKPCAYSSLFMQWINYVNVALEHVRLKSMMSNSLARTTHALLYDSNTGLLSRNGFEKEFVKRVSESGEQENYEFLSIELPAIQKTYYRSGEEKCLSIMRSFAEMLTKIVSGNELCGVWNENTFCVLTAGAERPEMIFSSVSALIKKEHSENSNYDFSIGVFSFGSAKKISASEAFYKSSINKIYSFNTSESSANPQFEKLCMLRSRIMKNPELPWNISEIAESLYLSKSYLQKIYKSYFNKSIIEEMIEFRIENAKELLTNTDLTVTEIARKCGYSSYNYFVRQFRSCENLSPSEYRNSLRKDN